MRTFKRFFGSVLFWAVLLIPLSAVVAAAIWFFVNVIFSEELGKFETIWKYTYLTSLIVTILRKFWYYGSEFSLLVGYARTTKIPLREIDEAWWDMDFRTKHGVAMFEWDREKFETSVAVHRNIANLADAVFNELRRH